nr:hypothetical protein Cduv_202 [Cedratvirus duvanny]
MAIRQPVTLYSTILKNYTYEELKELCFAPDSTFGNIFDCDWGVWRDKAVADFGISPEFFDLIKTLSGPQRYLQISTYVKLTPLSLAVEYDDKTLEGVYEPLQGYEEAKGRRDKNMLVWFAQRITPEENLILDRRIDLRQAKATIASWFGGLLTNLYYPPRNRKYDIHYLSLVISHGRVDILDKIIHKYFNLPKDFKIANLEKGGLEGPFPFYDLPIQNTNQDDFEEIVDSSLASGDVRIVDFVRSIFRDRNIQSIVPPDLSSKSLYNHGKPEEAYKIALRFIDKNTRTVYLDYMAELVLKIGHRESYMDIIHRKIGDIAFLQALLPYIKKYEIEEIFEQEEEEGNIQELFTFYPLSMSLLEQHQNKETFYVTLGVI